MRRGAHARASGRGYHPAPLPAGGTTWGQSARLRRGTSPGERLTARRRSKSRRPCTRRRRPCTRRRRPLPRHPRSTLAARTEGGRGSTRAAQTTAAQAASGAHAVLRTCRHTAPGSSVLTTSVLTLCPPPRARRYRIWSPCTPISLAAMELRRQWGNCYSNRDSNYNDNVIVFNSNVFLLRVIIIVFRCTTLRRPMAKAPGQASAELHRLASYARLEGR